ncbi:AraC family transcriptional regulator [Microbacterium sp.]|uniref:helix-turn-helix transcriptional regulator n=1 Tax=Microbacterium sp. TaxID=51671 RepID=UPI003A8448C8
MTDLSPTVVEASTVDEARTMLASAFEPYTVTPTDSGSRFHLTATITHLGRVTFARISYVSGVIVEAEAPLDATYCVAQATRGQVRLTSGRNDVRLEGDHSVVCDDRRRIVSQREAGAELTMLRIASTAVNEFSLDYSTEHHALFDMEPPHEPKDRARWQAVLTMAWRIAELQPTRAGSLWHSAMEQFVVTAMLSTHPHTFATRERASTWSASAQAAKRAAEFLQDHHADPVNMTELASSLGLTTRALQRGFLSVHGVTMTEYLTDLRLASAHRELASNPTATVCNVAYRWGFSSPSRFAARHRKRYGVLPSQVGLRAADE